MPDAALCRLVWFMAMIHAGSRTTKRRVLHPAAVTFEQPAKHGCPTSRSAVLERIDGTAPVCNPLQPAQLEDQVAVEVDENPVFVDEQVFERRPAPARADARRPERPDKWTCPLFCNPRALRYFSTHCCEKKQILSSRDFFRERSTSQAPSDSALSTHSRVIGSIERDSRFQNLA